MAKLRRSPAEGAAINQTRSCSKHASNSPRAQAQISGQTLRGVVVGQCKEAPLATFCHKIVMMRNNLRVLEQKVNASDKLSEADKFDLQQYITRCYGSLTTFNILFKNKEDQFSSGAQPA